MSTTPMQVKEQGSPGWWLTQLDASLKAKRPRLNLLHDYAHGNAPLMDIAANVREAYLAFQKRARTNFGGLVVDSMIDRTKVAAIRTGAEGNALSDSQAWAMWQANELDADSAALHRACFTMGEAFAIVGDIDPETDQPLITVEDPRNIAIARHRTRRRRVQVAMKTFTDEWTGSDHAYLYMAGGPGERALVWRAQRAKRYTKGGWAWVDEEPAVLPFEQVPVVWFPNLLDIDGKRTWGEFEQHLDVLDRINTTILQRVVIGAMQAFRQRAIMGLPLKDQNGDLIDYEGVFAADAAALWQLPPGAEVWESQITELRPLLEAARDDIKDYSAVTRTPLAELSPDSANQSAKGSELVESGLVHKVTERMESLSECWEQVVRLGFLWKGETERARATDMETLWMPPMLPSLAERFDAAAKAEAAGVAREHIMRTIVGMSPQEIARYASLERASDPVKADPTAA